MWMVSVWKTFWMPRASMSADGEFIAWDDVSQGWVPKKAAASLAGMTDVDLTGTADNQLLKYDLASASWKNVTPDYLNPTNGYTKTEIDGKLSALTSGMIHSESVEARTDSPPSAPHVYDTYIVGPTPTGLWTGQANNLATWDGTAWQFEAPRTNESHLVENVAETWHWNGTAWVKVAAASTGAESGAGDLWMVGAIQQSMLTEPQFKALLNITEQTKWCLADGRDVSGSKFATATGKNTVPDLRGAYLRMAGVNATDTAWNGGALNGRQDDTTRLPRNAAFATSPSGDHTHDFNRSASQCTDDFTNWNMITVGRNSGGSNWTATGNPGMHGSGNHTHTITGGGDAETRPKSYTVNYYIKIN